jgi:hypothetical protein
MTEREPRPDEPLLRIVSGNPTPDELAAVTVLLTALRRTAAEPEQPAPAGGWSDLSLRIRRVPAPGPGAWRSAAWG